MPIKQKSPQAEGIFLCFVNDDLFDFVTSSDGVDDL